MQDAMSKLCRDDRCVTCGKDLSAGTEAYWFADNRVVECFSCHAVTAAAPPPGDAAGGSARAEYERRSARELERKSRAVIDDQERRGQRVEKRPLLGKVANALTPEVTITPESQATKAWAIGAAGEERVAEVLVGVPGIEVLHDRRVPGSKANIDHIVVGPAGVFVVDAKKYEGSIEVVDKGSCRRTDWRLYVAGRDRTKLVDGVLGQVDVVRSVLGDEFASVPVTGVLCFIEADWGWLMRTKQIEGVTVLWPLKLPEHVAAAGVHGEAVPIVAARLRAQLKPAT